MTKDGFATLVLSDIFFKVRGTSLQQIMFKLFRVLNTEYKTYFHREFEKIYEQKI